LRNPRQVAVFLRELSSIFVLLYVFIYLQTLNLTRGGNGAYLAQFGTPPFLALSLVILGFSLYHSLTWFILTARAQPIKLGGLTLEGRLAFVTNIAILIVVSLIVVLLLFGVQVHLG